MSRTTIPDITAIPDDLSSKSGIPCQNITICDKAGRAKQTMAEELLVAIPEAFEERAKRVRSRTSLPVLFPWELCQESQYLVIFWQGMPLFELESPGIVVYVRYCDS